MLGTVNNIYIILILSVQTMLVTMIDYQQLEKIEVSGGLTGRMYSPVIERIYLRFSKFLERLNTIAYDPLDLHNDESNTLFLEDYDIYNVLSNDIDHRLAAVTQAYFDSSDNLMSMHKVNSRSYGTDIFFYINGGTAGVL